MVTDQKEKAKVTKGELDALELQLEADDIIQYRKRAYAAVAAAQIDDGSEQKKVPDSSSCHGYVFGGEFINAGQAWLA